MQRIHATTSELRTYRNTCERRRHHAGKRARASKHAATNLDKHTSNWTRLNTSATQLEPMRHRETQKIAFCLLDTFHTVTKRIRETSLCFREKDSLSKTRDHISRLRRSLLLATRYRPLWKDCLDHVNILLLWQRPWHVCTWQSIAARASTTRANPRGTKTSQSRLPTS